MLEADLCIIGAGAAGITLARALINSPFRVTLLESGGLEYDLRAQALNEGPSVGLPYFPLDTTRLRYFGGSTNHWGGICRPLEPLDFEARDWIPFSGWPIRKQDLDPYYVTAREVVQLTSDEWSASSWDERDSLSPLPLGDRTEPRITQFVPEELRSFGTDYRSEIAEAANITTYLHATVTEIETDEIAPMASRVRVQTLDGNEFSVDAGFFVLATGGIDNPRLLLASNRRQARGIGNQHDLVGRFFTEHPRFAAAAVAPTDPELQVGFYQEHQVDGVEIEGYVTLPPEVQRAESLVDVQVFVQPTYNRSFEAALDSEDADSARALARGGGSPGDFAANLMDTVEDLRTGVEFTVPGAPLPVPYPELVGKLAHSGTELRDALPALLGDVAALAYEGASGAAPLEQLTLVTRLDPAPNPESRVTLAGSRDALGVPRAKLDWRLSQIDRRSAIRAAEIVAAGFARSGLGRARLLIDREEDSWPADLEGGWHHMGTTRMSADPKRGVVDADCRVHGMANLFVAGSSVFPTGGTSTPTLTIVALALRLADHLRRVMR